MPCSILIQFWSIDRSNMNIFEKELNMIIIRIAMCLHNLLKGGKSKKGDRRKTARYCAHKLYEKGVLVEIEKVPTSSFKAVTIEFSSTDQVGVFEVSGKLSGFNIDKFNVVFECLLQVPEFSINLGSIYFVI